MCYCFTVLVVHLSYISHVEFCLLSHVVCFHTLDLCGLLFSHVFASIYFRLSFLLYYLDNCVRYLVLQSFFFFFCAGVPHFSPLHHTLGWGPNNDWQLPSLGVACSLELSCRHLDGKILYPPVELDPCKASCVSRDTSAGSVRLGHLLIFGTHTH